MAEWQCPLEIQAARTSSSTLLVRPSPPHAEKPMKPSASGDPGGAWAR
jgi:hypothetical protein